MPAVAVSVRDQKTIHRLGKKLGIRSQAGVVRVALEELERKIETGRVAAEIRQYVRKYGDLDRLENAALSGAAAARDEP